MADDRHKNKARGIRIPDERYKQAKEKAEKEGKSVTDVVNEALETYVRKKK
jgi:predicted DNA-binding protein